MSSAMVKRVMKDAVGEIAWVPFDAEGNVLADIERDLVAIKPRELREHAASSSRQVVAVAGGADKVGSIEAAMIDPCFSTLVTDVINARRLIDSKRVGGAGR
jgi:DNA-binding transcriptional regulator LsrR (DeoR family)